jgi:hypothetical protein
MLASVGKYSTMSISVFLFISMSDYYTIFLERYDFHRRFSVVIGVKGGENKKIFVEYI